MSEKMSDTYKTIQVKTEGMYREKGSKFLSFAFPVQSIDEIKEILNGFRKQYYDANHVCYAYMLGAERKEWRTNDDGEPSGTAGKPILGQINSRELTNILVIVVRYFGGILLGTSGLISAYKESVSLVLNEAETIEKTVDVQIFIRFEYPLMNEVMRIVKETDAQILSQSYENECKMTLNIRLQSAELLKNKLEKIVIEVTNNE